MNPRSISNRKAYTLIEALVASSILLLGIAAAASMSLSFVTQEEITERAARAFNYLDNAVALYQSGVDKNSIAALLPAEPVVTALTITDSTINATNLGTLPSAVISVTYKSTSASESTSLSTWTGGDKTVTRTASVEVIRVNRTLSSPLPRVDHFN
ncbi:MAG: prepilin-type N-terminal cleavage/methylation domain-containing protein [Verrucomicrobiales bacterium]